MDELQMVSQNNGLVCTVDEVMGHVALIQGVMKSVMKEGEHYGTVPGCGAKNILMKSGAEKLCLTFKLAPEFDIRMHNLERGHREVEILCCIKNAVSGATLGQGVGMCSTMESKYRWRKASRACPECGCETIIVGKKEYGGGFVCFAKKGGCGAKFKDDDVNILKQATGRVENEDLADMYNTVLKMAKKRALVDAVLTVTAASDIFTQDLEENEIIIKPVEIKNSKLDLILEFDELLASKDNYVDIWNGIRAKFNVANSGELPEEVLIRSIKAMRATLEDSSTFGDEQWKSQ